MAINTKATITSDITFTQSNLEGNILDQRQGSLSYSTGITSGVGQTQINAVYHVASGAIASGAEVNKDLNALTQDMIGGSFSMSFDSVKSFVIENTSRTTGEDLLVRTTGSNALTELFNGLSGNYRIKPAATYMYSDIYSGLQVNSSNKNVQIVNNGTGNIYYNMIAVGVTG